MLVFETMVKKYGLSTFFESADVEVCDSNYIIIYDV